MLVSTRNVDCDATVSTNKDGFKPPKQVIADSFRRTRVVQESLDLQNLDDSSTVQAHAKRRLVPRQRPRHKGAPCWLSPVQQQPGANQAGGCTKPLEMVPHKGIHWTMQLKDGPVAVHLEDRMFVEVTITVCQDILRHLLFQGPSTEWCDLVASSVGQVLCPTQVLIGGLEGLAHLLQYAGDLSRCPRGHWVPL